jgi:hypothetical protein
MDSKSSSTSNTGDAEFINTDGTPIETIHVKFDHAQVVQNGPYTLSYDNFS